MSDVPESVRYRFERDGKEIGNGLSHPDTLVKGNVVASGVRAYRILSVDKRDGVLVCEVDPA